MKEKSKQIISWVVLVCLIATMMPVMPVFAASTQVGQTILPSINEDDQNNPGDQVSNINSTGIAVTSVSDAVYGQWQFYNGSTWYNIAPTSNTHAFILNAAAKIRFVPNSNWNGTVNLTYRDWDGTGFTSFLYSDISGSSAFGTEKIATLTVNPVNDAPYITESAGNNYLSFPGDQYVNYPDLSIYTHSFTFEGWVKQTVRGTWIRIFDTSYGPDNFNLHLAIDGSLMKFEAIPQKGPRIQDFVVSSTESFPINQWMHVAAVYNDQDKTASIYWNGQLKAMGRMDLGNMVNASSANGNLPRPINYLGKSSWSQDGMFQGGLRDIRFWDKPKTPAEIINQMNITLTSDPNLVAYYKLNNPSDGAVAIDSSGNGRNGSIVRGGGPVWGTDTGFNSSLVTTENSPISKSFKAIDVDGDNIQVSADSNNHTLVPKENLIVTGVGENRTLTVSPALAQTGSATITLTVSDGILSNSSSIQLLVNSIPKGTITGTIYGPGHTPLNGATVTVNPDISTTTNSNGLFTLTNVPAGSQTITFSASGYNNDTVTGMVYGGQTTNLDPVTLVAIPVIPTTGTITGTVYGPGHTPLNGATVTVNPDISTTTNSNGLFTLTNVPAGSQTITFSASGYNNNTVTGMVYGGQTTNLDPVTLVTIPVIPTPGPVTPSVPSSGSGSTTVFKQQPVLQPMPTTVSKPTPSIPIAVQNSVPVQSPVPVPVPVPVHTPSPALTPVAKPELVSTVEPTPSLEPQEESQSETTKSSSPDVIKINQESQSQENHMSESSSVNSENQSSGPQSTFAAYVYDQLLADFPTDEPRVSKDTFSLEYQKAKKMNVDGEVREFFQTIGEGGSTAKPENQQVGTGSLASNVQVFDANALTDLQQQASAIQQGPDRTTVLTFKTLPPVFKGMDKGSVMFFDPSEENPYGFASKLQGVEQTKDGFAVSLEEPALNEVFSDIDISSNVQLTADRVSTINFPHAEKAFIQAASSGDQGYWAGPKIDIDSIRKSTKTLLKPRILSNLERMSLKGDLGGSRFDQIVIGLEDATLLDFSGDKNNGKVKMSGLLRFNDAQVKTDLKIKHKTQIEKTELQFNGTEDHLFKLSFLPNEKGLSFDLAKLLKKKSNDNKIGFGSFGLNGIDSLNKFVIGSVGFDLGTMRVMGSGGIPKTMMIGVTYVLSMNMKGEIVGSAEYGLSSKAFVDTGYVKEDANQGEAQSYFKRTSVDQSQENKKTADSYFKVIGKSALKANFNGTLGVAICGLIPLGLEMGMDTKTNMNGNLDKDKGLDNLGIDSKGNLYSVIKIRLMTDQFPIFGSGVGIDKTIPLSNLALFHWSNQNGVQKDIKQENVGSFQGLSLLKKGEDHVEMALSIPDESSMIELWISSDQGATWTEYESDDEIDSTTKNLVVNGLQNNTPYQFKLVVQGKDGQEESNILSVKTSYSSKAIFFLAFLSFILLGFGYGGYRAYKWRKNRSVKVLDV